MAASTKEFLQSTIASLNEAECVQVIEFIQNLQHKESQVFAQLGRDPVFTIPANSVSFRPVQPILGVGASASEQLIEDRR
ncbi:hypothetical protein [Leptolyngbya sp. NIES-2104]|uniref:hypothetical protein n=1 Tax=Leptolyngbya sp. NIES-2104 TaxID=1552121 RepID=UPI0006EC8025|nr:hypothetical protein [Leptolyngbya sp. NIES-2104]GAP93570.1 hypothetical protein NIES2104_00760 [Leptolyngbya sp. NIES-2104]